MDKKVDLDEKATSAETTLKVKPNSSNNIVINKRISLDTAVPQQNNSPKKIKITKKTTVVTSSSNPSTPQNYENDLEDEDEDDDDDSEDNESEESDNQNDNDDQKDDKKDDKKDEKKDDKKKQQNKKDYKSELKNKTKNKAKKEFRNKAAKKAAGKAAGNAAGNAAASGAAAGSGTAAGAAGSGGAAAGAGGAGSLSGILVVAYWVIIVLLIILIISVIVSLILAILGVGVHENSATPNKEGVTCNNISVINTDCDSNNKNCSNTYDGEKDYEDYIMGVVAAELEDITDPEFLQFASIVIRTHLQKKLTNGCEVEGNGKFLNYIDIKDSEHEEIIREALKTKTNVVLLKNEKLIDVITSSKHYCGSDCVINKSKANKVIDNNYSLEEIVEYFYGKDVTFDNNTEILTGNNNFSNPIKDITCQSAFGNRTKDGEEEFHLGIDMTTNYHQIYAADSGTVIKVYRDETKINDCEGAASSYGNYVIIEHSDGISTLYAHMKYDSIEDKIVEGYEIRRGELIGLVGSTGCSTGEHLHYEVRKNGEQIEPTDYLDISTAQQQELCKR